MIRITIWNYLLGDQLLILVPKTTSYCFYFFVYAIEFHLHNYLLMSNVTDGYFDVFDTIPLLNAEKICETLGEIV